MSGSGLDNDVTVVIATRDQRAELCWTLVRLRSLPERTRTWWHCRSG
ncbi:MAG TPA: hypothetical protein VGG75_41215 [Trebonia sp.]